MKKDQKSYLIDPNVRICDLLNQETAQNAATSEYKPVRLCRLCSQFLPIEMFPKGPVRYLCRTHWSAQVLECTKKRFLSANTPPANVKKRAFQVAKKKPLSKLRSISILVDSKEDAKKVFGQEKVLIGIQDVEGLIGCDLALRLIPSDPLTALSNINFIICTKDQRKLATTLWKAKQDPQAYLQLLQLLDLK
jgi:hypothetical protein